VDKGGGGFDSMWTSTTQYRTACHADMHLHGVSYHPYSDGSACTKWTDQVARRLLPVGPWSVACSPCIMGVSCLIGNKHQTSLSFKNEFFSI